MKLTGSLKEKEVYSYLNNKGEKLWMFRHKYYDGLTGKRKEKKKSGFQTEKAAIKALLEVKAQTLRGETKSLDHDNLTVAQWLDIWYEMNEKKWKTGTKAQRKNIIDTRIKPRIGHYKLQKLDRTSYQRAFINDMEKEKEKYSATTIKLTHNVFMIAINAAIEEEILIRNKLRKAILPEPDQETSAKFLTEAELNLLLKDVRENENITSNTLFHVLAFTGARKGEILGLQWQDIDFDSQTISIRRTRHEKHVNTPKTKNSYRTILVDPDIIAQLETYKKWCKKTLLKYGRRLKGDSFIFINDNGEIISSIYSNEVLRRIIKRTGIPEIVIHSLRHTHATILLNRGLEVKLIAERLGNSPDMIYKIYGHILKDLEQQAVQIFSASLASVRHQ